MNSRGMIHERVRRLAKPLQVYLEKDDMARLDRWSKERGCTKSEAVRVAIRALTRKPSSDPLLSLSGCIVGGPSDLSENVDRYLNETYVAEKAPRYRRSAARRRLRR